MADAKSVKGSGRAAPLPPEERREALIQAAIEVIRERHTLPTTRQIAAAAGVAEGTIFRVFTNKDAFFDAVIERTFDAQSLHEDLEKIDGDAGLETVMIDLVRVLQARFQEIFDIMGAFSMVGPPERFRDPVRQRRQEAATGSCVLRLLDPYADQLRLPVPEVTRLLRLLTFSGSHKHINDGEVLAPEVIVHTILYGVAASTGDRVVRPRTTRQRKGLETQQIRGN